jgi:nicotinamidase-related amidase
MSANNPDNSQSDSYQNQLIQNQPILMLDRTDSLLLVVDVQSRFVPVIHEGEVLVQHVGILMQAANLMGIPTLVSEQYPKGLGYTDERLQAFYGENTHRLEKEAFGCGADEAMAAWLKGQHKKQIVVCGIEAHVCVSQTVHQLLRVGYEVFLVENAVSSRTLENKRIALNRMASSGAVSVSTEMVLFEWMQTASHPNFKAIQALIK